MSHLDDNKIKFLEEKANAIRQSLIEKFDRRDGMN